MLLIQHNPIVEESEPKFVVDGGSLFVRWTERRANGELVDCEARVQLIAPHIVRVRQPEPGDR